MREMDVQLARANVLRHGEMIGEALISLKGERAALRPGPGSLAALSAISTNVLLLGKALIDNRNVSARVFSGKALAARLPTKYVIERVPIPKQPERVEAASAAPKEPIAEPQGETGGVTRAQAPAAEGGPATAQGGLPDAGDLFGGLVEDALPAIVPSEVLPPDEGAAPTKSAIMMALERQRRVGA